jgi:hypothetical protein
MIPGVLRGNSFSRLTDDDRQTSIGVDLWKIAAKQSARRWSRGLRQFVKSVGISALGIASMRAMSEKPMTIFFRILQRRQNPDVGAIVRDSPAGPA